MKEKEKQTKSFGKHTHDCINPAAHKTLTQSLTRGSVREKEKDKVDLFRLIEIQI